jgi:hypothetical protein
MMIQSNKTTRNREPTVKVQEACPDDESRTEKQFKAL